MTAVGLLTAAVVILLSHFLCLGWAFFDAAHTSKIVDLLRSDARGYFETEEHLHSHVESTLNRLFDEAHDDHHKQNNFIVSTSNDFNIELLQELADSERFDVVDANHFHVSLKPSELKNLMSTSHTVGSILGVVPVVPTMKIDKHLRDVKHECDEGREDRDMYVGLAALSHSELDAFFRWLDAVALAEDAPFSYVRQDAVPNEQRFVKFTSTCSDTLRLAHKLVDNPEVIWVEEFRHVKHANYWNRGVMESGVYYNQPMLLREGLGGAGQIIGVSDTGLDLFSTYFYDNVTIVKNAKVPNLKHRKVVSYTSMWGNVSYGDLSDDAEAHGTHVCGIVAGLAYENYGDYKRFNGVASDAKIAFFDIKMAGRNIALPTNLDVDLFAIMYNMGARMMTNSWGDSAKAAYDPKALGSDRFMFKNPEALIFFAAGNNGDPMQSEESPPPNPISSVNSPGIFKNGLTVGAGLNDQQSWLAYTFGAADASFSPNALARFSSRGPTMDNRLKPEILAPGIWVTSASGGNGTSYHTGVVGKAGTSMASPGAAAMGAVIRQYFMEGYYTLGPVSTKNGVTSTGFIPSGALIKAMIVASGKKITSDFATYDGGSTYLIKQLTGYPSNDQGYGRLQMNSVLNFGEAKLNPLSLFVVGDSNPLSPLYKELPSRFVANVTRKHYYNFTVDSDQTVRIVLTHTDVPPAVISNVVIVNDLTITCNEFLPYITAKNTLKVIDLKAIKGVKYVVTVSPTGDMNFNQSYSLVIVGSVVQLASTSVNSELLQSGLSTDDIPFVPAIIAMSVISFLILLAIVVIIIANRCPGLLCCCGKRKDSTPAPQAQQQQF